MPLWDFSTQFVVDDLWSLILWSLLSLLSTFWFRIPYAKVHKLPQSHCNNELEDTLFSWLHIRYMSYYIYYILYIIIYYILHIIYSYIFIKLYMYVLILYIYIYIYMLCIIIHETIWIIINPAVQNTETTKKYIYWNISGAYTYRLFGILNKYLSEKFYFMFNF